MRQIVQLLIMLALICASCHQDPPNSASRFLLGSCLGGSQSSTYEVEMLIEAKQQATSVTGIGPVNSIFVSTLRNI